MGQESQDDFEVCGKIYGHCCIRYASISVKPLRIDGHISPSLQILLLKRIARVVYERTRHFCMEQDAVDSRSTQMHDNHIWENETVVIAAT